MGLAELALCQARFVLPKRSRARKGNVSGWWAFVMVGVGIGRLCLSHADDMGVATVRKVARVLERDSVAWGNNGGEVGGGNGSVTCTAGRRHGECPILF